MPAAKPRSAPPPAPYSCYAIAAPGLEPLIAAELQQLAMGAVTAEPGGVAFEATAEQLAAANLWLRVASRVIVRVAEFSLTSFRELERRARQLPWERFVASGRPVRFRVTCRKSRLYHSDAVAQRLVSAVAHRLRQEPDVRAAGDAGEEDEGDDEQLFVVRLFHDRCTISVDSSGRLLHLRGYRQAVAKAPLRETLAAAMLLGSQWDPAAPLLDPLCGSGTIAIEAALLARRIAPGLQRDFAFRHWPEFQERAWRQAGARALELAMPAAPPIHASDRDAGAIAAAQANAARAGVAASIEFVRRPLSAAPTVRAERGWLVTNPPYGERVGDAGQLRDLYARLGQLARACCPGWTVALLSADRRLERQVGLPFAERLRTTNGGIPVRLVTADVAA